jgi:5-(carboxyamino)imidazole ribonucleotide mutase
MTQSTTPLVGIIMGSDSDLPTMRPAADILENLGVSWEMDIVSAHRTPDKLYDYARRAAGRGLKVIIAGAGGAAHLPGMTASLTDLPVIGVPVRTKTLDGLDSLLSIVQMPGGVPVATVAIDGGKNAGLLAARMLGMSDPALAGRLRTYRESLRDEVLAKAGALQHGYGGSQGRSWGGSGESPAEVQPDGKTQGQWAGLDGSPGSKA